MATPDIDPLADAEMPQTEAMTIGDEPVELVGLDTDVWARGEQTRGPAYISPEAEDRRDDNDDPAEILIQEAAHRLLDRMFDDLPLRTQYVLEHRYGTRGDVRTFADIGHELGLTRQGVQLIEKRALTRLRKDSDMHAFAYLTDRGASLPEPAEEEEETPEDPPEVSGEYSEAVAAWRRELWDRQLRGERVYVRGKLVRQPPFPRWPHPED